MTLITNTGDLDANILLMKQLCSSINKPLKNYHINITYKLADSLSKNMGTSSDLGRWLTNNGGSVFFSCINSKPNQAIVNYDSDEDEEILYMNNDIIRANIGKDISEIKLDTERRIYYSFDEEEEDAVSPVNVNAVELNMHLMTDETPLINRPGYVYSDT